MSDIQKPDQISDPEEPVELTKSEPSTKEEEGSKNPLLDLQKVEETSKFLDANWGYGGYC